MDGIVSMSDKAVACSVSGSTLPVPVSTIIHLMNRVHWLWRYGKLTEQIATSTDNMKRFTAGTLLRWGAPDFLKIRTMVRTAAKITLIALRIVELGKQKVVTYHSIIALREAAMTRRPLRARIRINLKRPTPLQKLVGPDHYVWIVRRKEVFVTYVTRVALCTADLFKQMLVTSLCYMSVAEALSLDAEGENEAICQIFLNSQRLLDEMSENKQHIYAELLRHKGLVQQILIGMKIPCQAETLIGVFATTIQVTERTLEAVERVRGYVGGFVEQGLSTVYLSISGYAQGWFSSRDPAPGRPLRVLGAA